MKIYNQCRGTIISIFKRLKIHMRNEEDDEQEEFDDDVDNVPDFFLVESDENMNEDYMYQVKKSLIIDEWKKRRINIERRERLKRK